MSIELQLFIYILVGVLLSLTLWKKEKSNSISLIIFYIGFGFFSSGIALDKRITFYFGIIIITISTIIALSQAFTKRR